MAFIAKAPDQNPDPAGIIEFCREHLAGFKCVKEVQIVDAIPRNTLGKVLKRTLKDEFK